MSTSQLDLFSAHPSTASPPDIPQSYLRPYQKSAVDATLEALATGKNPVIALPTGSGKSRCIAALCQSLPGRILVATHRKELLEQNSSELATILDGEHGVYSAGMGRRETDARIIFGGIQSIYRRMEELQAAGPFETIIVDEAHLVCLRGKEGIMYPQVFAACPGAQRVGLSVGGDSMVLIEGPEGIEFLSMKEFHEKVGGKENEFTEVKNYKIRSFDGEKFVWKSLKSILCHSPGNKRLFRVWMEKGRDLLLTEDHSVYKVIENGFKRVHGYNKPVAKLIEVRGENLAKGDFLLLEDSIETNLKINFFEISKYISSDKKWYVAGEFREWICKNIKTNKGYEKAWAARWLRFKGKYGSYVTNKEYISNLDLQKIGGKIYTEGARGVWTNTEIPVEAVSYILGFYIGDGWTNENRINFAVENKQLPDFLKKLSLLEPFTKFSIKIRKMKGNSVEVRLSNSILTDFFCGITNGGKAKTKRIPAQVFEFSNENIREFIQGMLDSDGSLSIRDTERRWYYTTTSKRLALDLCEILKRIGVVASLNKTRNPSRGGTIKGREIIGKLCPYVVHFSDYSLAGDNSGRKGRRFPFIMNGLNGLPVRILRITEEQTNKVYDFSIEDNQWQSFVASGVLVHNSATPYRLNDGPLWGAGPDTYFDTLAIDIGIRELTPEYLAPLRGILTAHDIDLTGVRVEAGEYVLSDMSQVACEERVVDGALNELLLLGKNRQHWLVFCIDVAHTELVTEKLRSRGISAGMIVGKTDDDERDETLEQFKSGNLRALVNCLVATTGFNIPSIDVVAMLRPTKSKSLVVQCIGRGSRKAPAKEDCLVLDFAGNIERHQPLDGALADLERSLERQAKDEAEEKKREAARKAREIRHDRKASLLDPFGNGIETRKTQAVLGLRYELEPSKKYPGKTNIVATYRLSGADKWCRAWICLEYPGGARWHAEQWFKRRGEPMPKTAQEGIRQLRHIPPPVSVVVDRSEKYPRIIMELFKIPGYEQV